MQDAKEIVPGRVVGQHTVVFGSHFTRRGAHVQFKHVPSRFDAGKWDVYSLLESNRFQISPGLDRQRTEQLAVV